MWSSFIGFMPPRLVLLCTILSFIVPLGVYSVNQLFHKYGDPPWKQPQEDETEHPTPPQGQS